MAEVSLRVSFVYDDFLLFSENKYSYWIIEWFNEHLSLNDVKDLLDMSVSYSIVEEFICDCLKIVLNPSKYVYDHYYQFIKDNNVGSGFIESLAKDLRISAKHILKNVCNESYNELPTGDYFLSWNT